VAAVTVTVLANRATNIGFSLLLLLTAGFFWKFGGPVAPNLKRHSWAMTAYGASTAVSYFVLMGRDAKVGNLLLPAVTVAVLIFWIFGLTRAGELQPATAGNEARWEEAEEMNRQMQKLADAVTLSPHGLKRR
jgi:hypothetical protein